MELFIPAKIQTKAMLGSGFEKSDLKWLILVALLGALAGTLVSLCLTKNFETVLLAAVTTGFAFGGLSYFALLKFSINLSFCDYCKLFVRFLREQRYYPYKKGAEWS